ncbi:centromere protein w [Anaeramoeba flamelloides]|uniref:Centromere protein w n=1 Tax=Anaeramoeba flamelloides TaxID=1746091 RepID=A0AAV7Y8C3_9EUKA|nr:centromere protein w [Anaeramoeba flamelloides]KAJ6231134.1 centromere protein w [Anaeramoeba flamelloides]
MKNIFKKHNPNLKMSNKEHSAYYIYCQYQIFLQKVTNECNKIATKNKETFITDEIMELAVQRVLQKMKG